MLGREVRPLTKARLGQLNYRLIFKTQGLLEGILEEQNQRFLAVLQENENKKDPA